MSTAAKRWVNIAQASQIQDGSPLVVEKAGLRLALCKVGNDFYAIEDICTHDDGPLAEGALEGDEIICPRHGAKFSVKTGAALSMPAITPVRIFPVRVSNGSVEVELEN